MTKKNIITIYQGLHGPVQIEIDKEAKTIWVTQEQISQLFKVDRSVITKHINNIFKVKELEKDRLCAIFAHTAVDGKTYQTKFYNLDAIISIGYRVNSVRATQFRQWATKILSKYINEGYAVNRKLIQSNYKLFSNTVADIKKLLPSSLAKESVGLIEIINIFANTWLSLDAYDKAKLPEKGNTLKKIDLTADELIMDVQKLKEALLRNKTASGMFAVERSENALGSIFRNVYQSFGGHEIYPSLEEKAANLLYLIIKDHPLIDGNKRTGAFSFIWFYC